MRYQSTRDPSHLAGLGDAIAQGLAPDGGLYVPTALPRLG
ncbi:MAG: Threonine synthase terminus, partial [Steroidobacteraceae bacterium]|nr:Threonine synthase terminus [Steroidobacteraceae bacterium]